MNNQPGIRFYGGTIDPVQEFYNKCHDESGRFCEGDGSGGDGPAKKPVKLRAVDRKAKSIAKKYHVGKAGTDHQDKDYVEGHLTQVGASLPSDLAMAGWLHDVLEDTDATPASLKRDGVDAETIRIVKAVSIDRPEHHPDLWRGYDDDNKPPYPDRIQEVIDKGGPKAVRVKLSDTFSNSDPARPRDGSVKQKYLDATKQMEDYLKDADPPLYQDYLDRVKNQPEGSFDWNKVPRAKEPYSERSSPED